MNKFISHIIVLFSFCYFFQSNLSAQIKTVDLGLSVRWASCNVGAKSPEELGQKFSWGSTSPYNKESDKNDEQDSQYKYFTIVKPGSTLSERAGKAMESASVPVQDGITRYVDNYDKNSNVPSDWYAVAFKALLEGVTTFLLDGEKVQIAITKYNNKTDLGKVDNKKALDLIDDAAYKKIGSSWRMPTQAEAEELIKKCTWTYSTLNGVKGFNVEGPNGNSIFIPLESSINLNILATDYWTKSMCDDPSKAWSLSLSRPWKRTSKSARPNYYFIRAVRR